jgi:hypothetical protein
VKAGTGILSSDATFWEATDEECEALERYFENETALGRVESEEEALVSALAGRLNAREHDFFEQRYLASPAHRQRVETIRRLSASHSTMLPGPRTDRRTWRFRTNGLRWRPR